LYLVVDFLNHQSPQSIFLEMRFVSLPFKKIDIVFIQGT
jgi:hypothetical protein